MQALKSLSRLWRVVVLASVWLVDRGARTALNFFALVFMLLTIATLSTIVSGRSPSWLPNTHSLDPNLLGAFGSLLIGFAGLYIGNRLRKFQEVEAAARAKLALNVDLRARVVCAGKQRILEVVVDIHNVSRATWFVPMAYLFIRPALDNSSENTTSNRKCRNIAIDQYSAALCQLQPDEHEQFLDILALTSETSVPVAVIVEVEVVGTSGKRLGRRKAMMKFVEFMNENNGARHRYNCIGRDNSGKGRRHGRRCFLQEGGSIDDTATDDYLDLLAEIRLFGRKQLVVLAEENRLAGETVVKEARLPAVLVEPGFSTGLGKGIT